MSEEYIVVDQKQAPVYVKGERLPTRNNAGQALEDLEKSKLVALTGPTGAHARIIAPLNDNIWGWLTVLTGIYNVTDHEGRFGKKGEKVNVVAHGMGHTLSRSQRITEALGTEYTKNKGVAQLSEGEEIELLSEEGTPIFGYKKFLEVSEDHEFLKKNPSFRIVRTNDVLGKTKHGIQSIKDLYSNSSVLAYIGGNAKVKVSDENEVVPRAEYFLNRTGKRFNRNNLGVWMHDKDGGLLLVFNDGYLNNLIGGNYLGNYARFAGVGAGGAKEDSPRSGDAPEKKVIVLNLEQVLGVIEAQNEFLGETTKRNLVEGVESLYQN